MRGPDSVMAFLGGMQNDETRNVHEALSDY